MYSASRSLVALMAVVASAGCGHATAKADTLSLARTLRVCADPNNLPYSNDRQQGFENRLAAFVGEHIGAKVEYVWWAQRRGFVRNTLRAGTCDVVMGVPTSFDQAATTEPYYRSSYMFVARAGTHLPSSLDDPFLARAKIGVQIIGDDFANSPPAHALTRRGFINNVRGYSVYGDYKTANPPAAVITAVSKGDVDVAIAWGPLAGYFARASAVPLRLRAVAADNESPFPFVFDISMGVARSNRELRDELNAVIAANRPAITSMLRAFAIPLIDPERTTMP